MNFQINEIIVIYELVQLQDERERGRERGREEIR